MVQPKRLSELDTHPPAVFFSSLFMSGILSQFYPLRLLPDMVPRITRLACGVAFLAVAVGFTFMASNEFTKRKEHPSHDKETRSVVDSGIFAYTRSPFYLGFMMVFPGASLLSNSMWYSFMGAFMFLYLHFLVIPEEEKFLDEHFQESWRKYKKRVRLWGLF